MSNLIKGRWSNFWSGLPSAYRGAIILSIPVISILPAIASGHWSRQAKTDAFWWIDRTKEVIRESNNLVGVLVDAETGIRAYTITKDTSFLEPYNKATEEIPGYLQRLEKLTKDNSSQQQKLNIIEQQIEDKSKISEQVLDIVASKLSSTKNDRLTKVFADKKAERNELRQSISAFKDKEWKLLDIRQQNLIRIERITNILLGVSIATILIGYGMAVKLYYQAEKEIEARLKELAHSNIKLEATNQLVKERNQELDQFTHIVSHDLKAPLRAISNLSGWIEEDLTDKLDEDTASNMTLLRNRVQRMNNFIDGLLKYSRAGKVVGKKTTVDVKKLLAEVVDSIAPPPNFVINVDDKMPVLQTEAIALQQVFSNLISNAIKHNHREAGTIIITAEEKEQYYQFSVADNGKGIAAEYQDKIFVIFQTLDSKDTKENTGIGLSIVKKIVEKQGGKIWLESELDRGTTFCFTWNSES